MYMNRAGLISADYGLKQKDTARYMPSVHISNLQESPSTTLVSYKESNLTQSYNCLVASILYKSIAGQYRPVRVADGPITARYRVIKNAYWDLHVL